MGKDQQGFENGIYKDIAPDMGAVDLRANLLRVVSKRLIRAGLDEDQRLKLIVDLSWEFGIGLSGRGIEHFLGE